MDIFTSFDSKINSQTGVESSEFSYGFTVRRDEIERAAITIECGPHLLHAGVGLVDDVCISYPGLDSNSSSETMIFVKVIFHPFILARFRDLCRSSDQIWIRSSHSPFPLFSIVPEDVKNNFVTREYLETLSRKVGRNHWWADACFVRDGHLHVVGWAIPPQAWLGGVPKISIDGNPAKVQPAVSAFASRTYWFLAGQEVLGFYAVAPCMPENGYSKIELDFGPQDAVQGIRRFPFYQLVGDVPSKLPVPPVANIERVAGAGANQATYLNGGKTDFERFRSLIKETTGVTSLKSLKLLDWGVGCGRLIRHFIDEDASATGVDIDADNILWCQTNLKEGKFATVDLLPPTSLPSNEFDVIISSSVLSHLTEPTMHAWLQEMNRVLRPDGTALLSFNGDGNAYLYAAGHPPAVAAIQNEGFFDEWRSIDLDGAVVGAEDYYRFTIMSDRRGKEIFEKWFEWCGFVRGVTSMHQDVAVLRKRSS